MSRKKIGLFLFDRAEELDFVGPFEVFSMVNNVASRFDLDNPNEILLISEDGKDITGAKGMRIGIDYGIDDCPPLDVFCIPGGFGTRELVNNAKVVDWVASATANCDWVTSVCTGSFILSKAGLLDGRKATTHWAAFEEFKTLGLAGELLSGVRYVRDGNVVTSAGVSAGIDMALWLTGQMYDVEMARTVQKVMEYDPAPPYTAEV